MPRNNLPHIMTICEIKKGFKPVVRRGYGSYFPEALPVSEEVRDLLSILLQLDPKERPTAAEALDHTWIRHHGGRSEEVPETVTGAIKYLRSLSCVLKQDKIYYFAIIFKV